LHGGANEGVIHMLQEVDTPDRVEAYIERALAEKKKIMGIGHRVYKVLDPRAPILKAMAIQLSSELGEPKWIEMSERIAALMKKKACTRTSIFTPLRSTTHLVSRQICSPVFSPSRGPQAGRPMCWSNWPATGCIVH